jgi:protein-disulfide isomerase
MNNKNYFIAFGIAVIIVIGTWLFGVGSSNGTNTEISPVAVDETVSAIQKHIKGNKEAVVKLVEYSDIQCPACGMYYPVVKQIVKDFGDNISFEYRHFPLRSIHQNAQKAALAAEAAGLQGKFWEMHDILFENQKDWSNKTGKNIFSVYAEELGLDIPKFESDMAFNKDIKNKVENDYQSGLDLKVNATPTFFLNDAKMENPRSYEEFKSIIQQFILAQ